MKIETSVIYFNFIDLDYAEKVSGTSFSSIEEAKNQFANDGIHIYGTLSMDEFMHGWNDVDNNVNGTRFAFDNYVLSYIYIVT